MHIHPKCPAKVAISAYQPRRLGSREISYTTHDAASVSDELSRLRAAGDGLVYRLSPWQWVTDDGACFGYDLIQEIKKSLGE